MDHDKAEGGLTTSYEYIKADLNKANFKYIEPVSDITKNNDGTWYCDFCGVTVIGHLYVIYIKDDKFEYEMVGVLCKKCIRKHYPFIDIPLPKGQTRMEDVKC